MKTVGLITEYNPFHNGHLYHIQQAKKMTGADYAVVIMSGNYVQRGCPAILPKQERAAMALANGADLVLELPVFQAAASAEYFALGAVSILNRLGFIDSLCFGCECGDIELLDKIADLLLSEPEEYLILLKSFLKDGHSYPAARSLAVLAYMNDQKLSFNCEPTVLKQLLDSPNNILGIEYLKALKREKSAITPYGLTRISSGYHEQALTGTVSSATAIRRAVMSEKEVSGQIPESVSSILNNAHNQCFPIYEDDFSLLLKYKLLISAPDFDKYADVSPELSSRISKLLDQYNSYSQFCQLLKTKEMTYSRISRSLLHILLDIRKVDQELPSPYVRLLGFRRQASALLASCRDNDKITVITKLADAKKLLQTDSMKLLEKDILASHIYYSAAADKFRTPCRNEYRQTPLIL